MEPLRVAIDCRTLQSTALGGVGRGLAAVVGDLAANATLDLLVDARRGEPIGTPAGARVHGLRAPLLARGPGWLQLAVPRWLHGYTGLFHCPFYGLPYLQPVPMVVTIHDVTFEFAREWFSPVTGATFRRQARWAARTAARILTDSAHVRSMLLERYERYGVTPERVIVATLPVDPSFRPEPDGMERRLAALGLERPYVITLGGAQRRQLNVAAAAWRLARDRLGAEPDELPLVVVGTEAPQPERGVLHVGVLDDADLAAVVAGARAFCYATRYEGYGMPALEAAASGVPVVCARVGSLPEVLEGAAAWCDEPEAEPLSAALADVLADDRQHRALAAAGLARTRALPRPAETAAVMLRAYREALEG